jgi:O-antigen/teichoic acid export membrane protein
MSEANKNTLINLAKILGGFAVLVALMILIPSGSIAQYILAVVMVVGLVIGVLYYTALGNPIKKLIKKFKKKEEQ